MTADDTRVARKSKVPHNHPADSLCLLVSCPRAGYERGLADAARRDPEPVASADAAWEALAHDFATNGPWNADAMVARHRPAIEAAIRGTEAGLDVERLARALVASDLMRRYSEYAIDAHEFTMAREGIDVLADQWAAIIAADYARLASADSEPS